MKGNKAKTSVQYRLWIQALHHAFIGSLLDSVHLQAPQCTCHRSSSLHKMSGLKSATAWLETMGSGLTPASALCNAMKASNDSRTCVCVWDKDAQV